MVPAIVVASTSKVRGNLNAHGDCFVAMLLAKTRGEEIAEPVPSEERDLAPRKDRGEKIAEPVLSEIRNLDCPPWQKGRDCFG